MLKITSKFGVLTKRQVFLLGVIGLLSFFVVVPQAQARDAKHDKPATLFSATQLYSRGSYGQEVDTAMHATIIKMAYRKKDWGASLSVPFLNIIDPAVEILEYIEIDVAGVFVGVEEDGSRKGIGDTVVSFDRVILRNPRSGTKLQFGTSVKLPTGNESKRLGNGETDVSLFAKGRLRKRNSVFNAVLGYQIMGDTDLTNYNNRLFLTAGFFQRLDRHWGAGLGWRFKQPSRDNRENQQSLSAFVSRKLNRSWGTGLRLNRGLSDSVADFSLSVQLSHRFH